MHRVTAEAATHLGLGVSKTGGFFEQKVTRLGRAYCVGLGSRRVDGSGRDLSRGMTEGKWWGWGCSGRERHCDGGGLSEMTPIHRAFGCMRLVALERGLQT